MSINIKEVSVELNDLKSDNMKDVPVGGINVKPFASRDQLIDYASARGGILVAVNAEKTVNANDHLRSLINANIGYCDGAGAVKALRHKGATQAIRIPGCELWLDIVARCYRTKSFYLVGSRREVVEGVVKKLRAEYPGINIVGYRDGFIRSDAERAALLDDIVDKKPDVVFVAMGSPKQEFLMEEMLSRHKAIYQGLGGSFDLYMGLFKRAPKAVRSLGCEWLWRFVAQPTRLRRITPYMRFAWRLYGNKL